MIIEHLDLRVSEAASMAALAADLRDQASDSRAISSLNRLRDQSQCVSPAVTDIIGRLRSRDEDLCAASIGGLGVAPLAALRTPARFGQYDSYPPVRALHGLMLLFGALLGVPYHFITQQRGNLILDVFPLAGRETDQLGSSSTCMLEWHNEDAHHPMRADFSILMCIKNDQQAATKYAAAAELELPEGVENELRRSQFVIIPDASHSYSYNVETSGVAVRSAHAFSQHERATEDLVRIPVLTGHPANPMICVDFPYMPPRFHTSEALEALSALKAAIEQASHSIVLQSGHLLAFDNRRGVHGREGFTASYDGTDRWLKRLNVLRESTLYKAPQNALRALRVVA